MRKKFCGLIFRSYIFLVESLISQGGGGSSGPAPAVDWEHGQTLSSGSAVPEDGVVKSGTFSAYFGGIAGTLTSYTNLVINGVQVKSGGRIAYYAHGGVKQTNIYILLTLHQQLIFM